MLSPKELEKRSFSRAMRGYNMDEVDAHIDFLCEKYELLYSEYLELNAKLAASLENARSPEELERIAASRIVANAKSDADEIVADAEEQASRLYEAAKRRTDKELKAFKHTVAQYAAELIRLKRLAQTLRQDMIDSYSKGILQAQGQTPEAPFEKASEYASVLLQTVLADLKDELTEPEEKAPTAPPPVKDEPEKKSKPVPKKKGASKFRSRSVKDAIKEINSTFGTEDADTPLSDADDDE